MNQAFNIYCDESCHLEHDQAGVMILGAVWCPLESVRTILSRIQQIKKRHALSSAFEMKWTKVSPAKLDFYKEVLDFFFADAALHFRALIVPDKAKLRHEQYSQTHDDWYYKMYFDLLKVILNPYDHYQIYLDIKDTRSVRKVASLHEILCNNLYDFSRQVIGKIQIIRSQENNILHLTDLLTGAIAYINRALVTSSAKRSLVESLRKQSGYSLLKTTLFREDKVNLFRWEPRE
jgi:hypothetical protein